jgi:hypothetical protein
MMGAGWRWLAGLVALAACSDLDGLATSTPGPDAGAPEASTPSDASTGDESPADAGIDGPFCASRPGATFCADFDHGGLFDDGFNGVTISPEGGSLSLDFDELHSPPASLYAHTKPFADSLGAYRSAFLTRSLTTPFTKRAHIELAVRAVSLGGAQRPLVVTWDAPDSTKYFIYFEIAPNVSEVVESIADAGFFNHQFLQRRVQAAEWARIAIDISFEDRSLRVTSDGQNVFGDPQTIAAAAKGGNIALHVGQVNQYDQKGGGLSVDDVLLLAE